MNDLTTKQSVVEELRKRKGFSMSEICGDYVSHSSYSRFINHQQLMSIDKLMYILKQMDLSFREATLFDHVIQAANEDWLLMERLLKEGELAEMAATVELFEAASYREYDAYGMMAIQIRLKMGGEVADKQIASLKKYLFQVHNWTYKEMYLFTFILDKVSTQIILLRVRRAFQRAADPYYLERNLNLIILLEAAHLELLKRQELTAAQETFDKLDQLYVNKAYVGQQAFRAINRLIHELVTDEKPDTLTRLEALYHNFLLCEADFLALRLKSRYTALQAVYQLPDLTLEQ